MIELKVEIDEAKAEALMKGDGSKREVYIFLGLLEEIKVKMLTLIQQAGDDGSTTFFIKKKKGE